MVLNIASDLLLPESAVQAIGYMLHATQLHMYITTCTRLQVICTSLQVICTRLQVICTRLQVICT